MTDVRIERRLILIKIDIEENIYKHFLYFRKKFKPLILELKITMKRIGILSDTHGYWDERYIQYFNDCDEIWHAGDIGDISIIEKLESICPVRAVRGNADFGEVARKYGSEEIFKTEDVRVYLTHIGGYPGRWVPGIKQKLLSNGIKLMIDGHSHILKVIYDKELDLLHINPGAAGQQGWHKKRTLVKLEIDGKNFQNCEIIELG